MSERAAGKPGAHRPGAEGEGDGDLAVARSPGKRALTGGRRRRGRPLVPGKRTLTQALPKRKSSRTRSQDARSEADVPDARELEAEPEASHPERAESEGAWERDEEGEEYERHGAGREDEEDEEGDGEEGEKRPQSSADASSGASADAPEDGRGGENAEAGASAEADAEPEARAGDKGDEGGEGGEGDEGGEGGEGGEGAELNVEGAVAEAPDAAGDGPDEGASQDALRGPTAADLGGPGLAEPREETEGAADLWEAAFGRRPDAEKRLGDEALARMDAEIAASQVEVRAEGQSHLASLDAAAETAVGAVRTAHDDAEKRLHRRYGELRVRVDEELEATVAMVEERAETSAQKIDAKADERKDELRGGIAKQRKKLPKLRQKAEDGPGQALDNLIESARNEQERAVNEAKATARSKSRAYEGREASGKEKKRNEARANAALRVGDKVAEEIREATEETIGDLEDRRKNLPKPSGKQADAVEGQLDKLETRIAGHIDDQAKAAKKELRKEASQVAKSLRRSAASVRTQLEEGQSQAAATLAARAETAVARIRGAGAAAKVEFGQLLAAGGSSLNDRALRVRQNAQDAGDVPPAEQLEQAVEGVIGDTKADEGEVRPTVAEAAEALRTGLLDLGQGAANKLVGSVDALMERSEEGASKFEEGLKKSLEESTTSFKTRVKNADDGFGGLVKDGIDGAGEAVDRFDGKLDEQREQLEEDMGGPVETLREKLDEKLEALPDRISEAAEKAAAEIKAWWKKALISTAKITAGVLAAVGTFVAVTAFAVGTLGLGPLAAAMLAGALAGVAALLVTDTVSALFGQGQSPLTAEYWKANWKKYLVTAGLGAAGGAIGHLVGPAVLNLGPVSSALSTGTTMSTLKQATDVLVLGQSWSWNEWVLTFSLAGLTAGVGSKIQARGTDKAFIQRAYPGQNSWNSFQQRISQVPRFQGMSSSQRSHLYGVIKGMPSKTGEQATEDVVKEVYAHTTRPEDRGEEAKLHERAARDVQ